MATEIESFFLPAAMRQEIIAHARQESPRECCGLISGRDGALTELYRMTNTYEGIDFYRIDDMDLYRLYTDLDAKGDEIAVIYHSHPVSVAYPSSRDVEYAAWSDPVYVICSLEDQESPVLRAFRIVDDLITELAIN